MNTIGRQPMYGWNTISWKKVERVVLKLQKRMYRAQCCGDVKLVRSLQRLLMKSWSARLLAVRRDTQDNQGKKTAGVDGKKSFTPDQRLVLVNTLSLPHETQPVRRVWIPKPATDEKRPLGIPMGYAYCTPSNALWVSKQRRARDPGPPSIHAIPYAGEWRGLRCRTG